jgi:hypothetical protein
MNRIIHAILLAVAVAPLAVLAAEQASGAKPVTTAPAARSCTGTVSGAVVAKFNCTVSVVPRGDGSMKLTFAPTKLPKGLKAFIVGEFDVPGPVVPGTYPFDRLTSAKVVLTSSRHVTYVAERAKRKSAEPPTAGTRRGEIALTIDSIQRVKGEENSPHGAVAGAAGSYKARLVPSAGTGSEVNVDVRF